MAIGKLAIFKNLQKNIKDLGMSFFDLIKEYYRVWATTNLLGKFAAVFVANITGRRTNETRNVVLLAKFRHINLD